MSVRGGARSAIDESVAFCRLQERWLSSLAHDFASPLFALRGYLRLAIEAPAGMPEPQRKYVEAALESVARLVALNQELAHFPVVGTSRLEVVEIWGLLREAAVEAQRTLTSCDLQLTGDSREPLTSVGNREKLAAALHATLLVAGQSAAPEACIGLTAREQDGQVVIEIGVSRSEAAGPFDTRPEIVAARHVCRMHGGSLLVSDEGRFAATIELPVIRPEECS